MKCSGALASAVLVHNPSEFCTISFQLIRKKMVQSAKESIKLQASNLEIYGKMQEVFMEMDKGHTVSSHTCEAFLYTWWR